MIGGKILLMFLSNSSQFTFSFVLQLLPLLLFLEIYFLLDVFLIHLLLFFNLLPFCSIPDELFLLSLLLMHLLDVVLIEITVRDEILLQFGGIHDLHRH